MIPQEKKTYNSVAMPSTCEMPHWAPSSNDRYAEDRAMLFHNRLREETPLTFFAFLAFLVGLVFGLASSMLAASLM